jgi:hypothetical protein
LVEVVLVVVPLVVVDPSVRLVPFEELDPSVLHQVYPSTTYRYQQLHPLVCNLLVVPLIVEDVMGLYPLDAFHPFVVVDLVA